MAFHRSILNSVPVEILTPRDHRVGGCTKRQDGSLQGVPTVQRRRIHRSESGFYPSPLRAIETRQRDYVPTDIIFPLEEGLRTLSNLENLYIRIPNFLPNLRAFSTYHTGTRSPLLSFLNRHHELTHLNLIRPSANAAALLPGPGSLPLLHLPRLAPTAGDHLRHPPRGLVHANIWGAPPGTDLDALLSALGDATAPSTPFALTFL